jgi:hypothetical protein
MNNARVVAALNTISLAFGELAEALQDAPPAHQTAQEPSPFVDLPDEVFTANFDQPSVTVSSQPQGHLLVCPKHHVPFTEGSYGPYCKQVTDDPAWGKQKGDRLWCRITPKNAAEWLRITAAA